MKLISTYKIKPKIIYQEKINKRKLIRIQYLLILMYQI